MIQPLFEKTTCKPSIQSLNFTTDGNFIYCNGEMFGEVVRFVDSGITVKRISENKYLNGIEVEMKWIPINPPDQPSLLSPAQ